MRFLLLLLLLGCDSEQTATDPSQDAEFDARVDAELDSSRPDSGGEPDAGPDAASDAAPSAPARLALGEFSVEVAADGSVELFWGDQRRLRFGPESFQLGVVPELDEAFNYDPWYVFVGPPSSLPVGLEWQAPTAASVQGDDALITIDLSYPAGEARLELRLERGVTIDWTPPAERVAYFRLWPEVDPEEEFYGLGSALDTPNHRGKQRPLQLEIDLGLESVGNEVNVPVPLVIGTNGWGLFVENDHPMAVDLGATDPERLDFYVATGLASAEGLRVHLFASDHPLLITGSYYRVAGKPRLPAPWALGPWLWRDENRDQAEVESDLRTMRELDLAATGIWVDRPFASGVSSFDFRPGQFTDAQAMIDLAHDLGFRFALWHTAYVGEDQEATAELHAEAEAEGYYPPVSGAIVNDWGRLVDLTNPEAYAWWQALIRRYTEMGVEGFKLDYVQDIVVGVSSVRNVWAFADGSTERTMHKRYQALYHQVFAETLPETGGFLLTRTGVYGDQTNGVIIWPGDLDANMALHRERYTDRHGDTYNAVGGMGASMVDGLSLGPSGFPFYGADTGGYRHCPPDKETFTRWFQQTALSSVMQIGTSCNDVAWEFEEANGFDQEMLDTYRRYTRLHLRLWPLAWSLAHSMLINGIPLQRPFGLQHPELGMHPWDTYFFGDDLLVAPVVTEGARARIVPFPPGDWFDWWTGERIGGGVDQEVPAPLDTLPLYLREGGIVPMLRPTIDTLAPVTDPEVDSFDTDPGRLYARVAAGPANDLRLYDGTVLEQSGGRFTIEPGEVFTAGVQLEIMGLDAPTPELPELESLEALESSERGWWYEAERNILHLRLAPGENALTF